MSICLIRYSHLRAALLVVLVACSGAPALLRAQDEGLAPYRLEQVFPQLAPLIAKSMEQSPQLLQKATEITQAEGAFLQNRSAMLPRLDGSIYYSTNSTAVSQGSSATSKNDGLFYSISLYQPVFQWGTLKAQSDVSKIAIEIAQKNYAEAYRILAVTIRQQYLMLVLRKATRRIAAENVRVTQAVLDVEEEKLRTGVISTGDIMGPRISVDEAKLAYERTDSELSQAKRTLSRLTGQPEIADNDIPDALPISQEYYGADRATSRLAFFSAAGVDDTWNVQVLQAQIKQADLNYKIAKFRLYPKLAAVATLSQSNTTNASQVSVTQVGVNSQSLNLQANWSIFDGFATSGAKMAALAAKRSAERQLDLQRRVSLDQARDLEAQLRFLSRAVRLADTRRYLAEDLRKRSEENLRRGVGTQKDVDVATSAFNAADLTAMQQRAELLTRWSDFLSLTGADAALGYVPSRYIKNSK